MTISGTLSIIAAASVFGTAGPLIKALALPATALAGFRLFVPAAFLLVTRPGLRQSIIQKPNKTLLIASMFTAIRAILLIVALLYAAVSKAIFVLYTWPIFFAVFNRYVLKEEVSAKTKALLILAFAGILLVYSGEEIALHNQDILGMVLMLIVAIMNAAVITVFKRELVNHPPQEMVLYDNIVGALLFFPFIVYNLVVLSPHQILMAVGYAALMGLIGHSLMMHGLSKVPGSVASILSYVEVVVAAMLGVLLFGEEITTSMAIGGGFIVLAAALARLQQPAVAGCDRRKAH